MSVKNVWRALALLSVMAMVLAACTPAAPEPTTPPSAPELPPAATEPPPAPPAEPFVIGMLLVGPFNDHGWSQAHYEAGEYVVEHADNVEFVYLDKVNPADRPGTTPDQLAEDLVAQGARLVIFNSDDMKDASTAFAQAHPEVAVVMASGDQAWVDGAAFVDQPNLANVMGRMEYGKMMAGCAAALTTQTGQIGYLGPLINDETRRLSASAFLGARYCWDEVLGNDPAALTFKVTWIGFWFNIPGFTSDPTQVADDFFNSGFDVVISGIDTTEALVEANKLSTAGQAGVGRSLRLHRSLRRRLAGLPGGSLLQLGPGLPQAGASRSNRVLRIGLLVERTRLERHQQSRHERRGLRQGRGSE